MGSGAEYESFGSATPSYDFSFPSPWVNGGSCTFGTGLFSGTDSVGTNTDSFATCPPTQSDVNEGYVVCTSADGIGSDGTGPYTFFTYTTDDVFFNGQPVPQASTVSLSSTEVEAGDTVSVTGGTNWWGGSGNSEPSSAGAACTEYDNGGTQPAPVDLCNASGQQTYGNSQYPGPENSVNVDFYPTHAPQVYIGTNSTTAHNAGPVTSNVTLYGNIYYCTGDLQDTNATAAHQHGQPLHHGDRGPEPQLLHALRRGNQRQQRQPLHGGRHERDVPGAFEPGPWHLQRLCRR